MNTINKTEKIMIKEKKTIKLNNVLIREVSENEFMDVNKIEYMMDSYIKSKGNSSFGPMINYSVAQNDGKGQVKIRLKIMIQLENPIHNIDSPYEFKSQIRVSNCLFARFQEKEENLRYAYSKLGLYAFENDINLRGDSYTVFVNKDDHGIVTDIFMERAEGVDQIESL